MLALCSFCLALVPCPWRLAPISSNVSHRSSIEGFKRAILTGHATFQKQTNNNHKNPCLCSLNVVYATLVVENGIQIGIWKPSGPAKDFEAEIRHTIQVSSTCPRRTSVIIPSMPLARSQILSPGKQSSGSRAVNSSLATVMKPVLVYVRVPGVPGRTPCQWSTNLRVCNRWFDTLEKSTK